MFVVGELLGGVIGVGDGRRVPVGIVGERGGDGAAVLKPGDFVKSGS